MTENEFWTLIKTIDREALDQCDEDAALEPLFDSLQAKSEAELFSFEELLAQKLYALDGEIYASHTGESGQSGDGFLYMRCYIVARGKHYYERVLRNPKNMPNSIDHWCEGLLSIHHQVWAERTGQDPSEWPFQASVSYETFSNQALWAGDKA